MTPRDPNAEAIAQAAQLEDLATQHELLGRTDEARHYLTQAIGIVERVGGPNALFDVALLLHLAHVEEIAKNQGARLVAMERAVAIAQTVYGPNHPNMRDLADRLCSAHDDKQQPACRERFHFEHLVRTRDPSTAASAATNAATTGAATNGAATGAAATATLTALSPQGTASPRAPTDPALPANQQPPSGGAAVNGNVANAAAVVQSMAADFRRCYNRGLQEDPSSQGSVRLRGRIGASGEVLSADTYVPPRISATVCNCLLDVMMSKRFGPPEGGGATIVIPITFVSQ